MKILAIDTSTKFLSAAIIDGKKVLAAFKDRGELKHFTLLMPTIDNLLKKSKLRLKEMDAIALSIGPGSFTGLRIGVAMCKAINLALSIPIVAVPTLDAIAYNFISEGNGLLSPLIDAKKKKIYSCFYKTGKAKEASLKRVAEYVLTDIDTLLGRINKPTLIFGDGVTLYGDYCRKNPFVSFSTKEWYPKAEVVGKLGLEKALKGKFENPDKIVPMYLHSQYCQVLNGDESQKSEIRREKKIRLLNKG